MIKGTLLTILAHTATSVSLEAGNVAQFDAEESLDAVVQALPAETASVLI